MPQQEIIEIVIDADVIRGAGYTASLGIRNIFCQAFLQAVLDGGFTVVGNQRLRREWKFLEDILQQWESGKPIPVQPTLVFRVQWMSNLISKGKLRYETFPKDKTLTERLRMVAASYPKEIAQEINKDIHLIDTALASGNRIASCDNQARWNFQMLAQGIEELKMVLWVNPEIGGENPIGWLQNGAPDDEYRRLGYRPVPMEARPNPDESENDD